MTKPRDAIPTPIADMLARRPTVDLKSWRGVRLIELADGGDVAAMIEWLQTFGGPEWQIVSPE